MKDLEKLVKNRELRSADRANLVSMLKKLKRGEILTYQERLNCQAYVQRYRRLLDGSGE